MGGSFAWPSGTLFDINENPQIILTFFLGNWRAESRLDKAACGKVEAFMMVLNP